MPLGGIFLQNDERTQLIYSLLNDFYYKRAAFFNTESLLILPRISLSGVEKKY